MAGSFWLDCAIRTEADYYWSLTARKANSTLQKLSKPTLSATALKQLRTELTDRRRARGERLINSFSDRGGVNLGQAWADIEDKVQNPEWLKLMSPDDIRAFVDATAWGYSKDVTGITGRPTLAGLAKPLGMNESDIRALTSEDEFDFGCPNCGELAQVRSPCAPVASYAHPVRIDCGHCGHSDVLGRAPLGGWDQDLRAIGGRLKCRCDKCSAERRSIGQEAAEALKQSLREDLITLHQTTKSLDWLGKDYGLNRFSYGNGVEISESLRLQLLQNLKAFGGANAASGEQTRQALQASADETFRHRSPQMRLATAIDSGVRFGWLLVVEAQVPPWDAGGQELAFEALSRAFVKTQDQPLTWADFNRLLERLKDGEAAAFEALHGLTYADNSVLGSARFRLQVDTAYEFQKAASQVPPSEPYFHQDFEEDERPFEFEFRSQGLGEVAGYSGQRYTETSSPSRTPVLRGLGERAHLAWHDRLLHTARALVPALIRDRLQSEAVLVAHSDHVEGKCRYLLKSRSIPTTFIEGGMGMRTVSKARKLRRVYGAARVSLGTTLMKRDSSNAERDVPILRADFEVEFEADAFTIELGVSGLAASEKTDLTEAINVKAQPHRFRVLGIVLGEEMKLGEAVDLLRDVKEAAVIHYDDERLINGGFFMPNDHAGLTMFLTDSERLYEALCDEFDGVLIGEGQRVQQFDLAEIERHLEPVIEVR